MVNYAPIFAPTWPSKLRRPSGPSSPASPLTPSATSSWLHDPASSPTASPESQSSDSDGSPPHLAPAQPLSWVWSCHICHSSYPLAVTRRCLHDGHYLCAGRTTDRHTGKTKKHKPCQSEFDYDGWSKWGRWRRNNTQDQKHVIFRGKDCSNHCDFPSHCQHQSLRIVETPDPEPVISRQANPATTFDQIISPASSRPDQPSLKRSSLALEKFLKAAEKRTSHITTILSPVQEEFSQPEPSVPKKKAPKIEAPDFRSFKARMDAIHNPPKKAEIPSTPPLNPSNKHIDTNDISNLNASISPPSPSPPSSSSSSSSSEENDIPFPLTIPPKTLPRFEFELRHQTLATSQNPVIQGNEAKQAAKEEEEEDFTPTSPRRNAWDWSVGEGAGGSDGGILIPARSSWSYEALEDIWKRVGK